MNIAIIGAGKLGTMLAFQLSEEDNNVTVVDLDEERVRKIVDTYDVQGVFGTGIQCDVLSQAGVEDADLVIATTQSDEKNILCCMIAQKMGAKNTIARVRNPEYSNQIDFMRNQLGVTMLINPDMSAALEISRILRFPSVVNIDSFSNGRIDMAEIKITAESPICNTKIMDIPPKYKNKMLICAVSRDEQVFIPNGEFVVKENDNIHVTGSHKYLGKTVKYLAGKKKSTIKEVMLIGGSRTAIYLANLLALAGKKVILVEKNKDKCNIIDDLCPEAVVIKGDATDHSMLEEIGINNVDAVVTLTGSDETNFLVSVYAKNLGVSKNITKINNTNFTKMLDKLGQDSHINVSMVASDTITQFVRAKKNASSSYMRTLYKLVDGQIEAVEFQAGSYVSFLGKPLCQIKTKKNILVAAINRNNKIIFPGGSDTIEEGDYVIVVSKDSKLYNLNDILA